MKPRIHPTAIIDPKAEIDSGVDIGPFCIVKNAVKIRKGTRLLSHVTIDGSADIGENCTIHPYAGIGFPPQDLKYKGENTKLVIGNNNTIREYVSIHRASVGGDGETVIGNNNFLMAYVHIAHDCKIGNNIVMANAATLAGHVLIEDNAVVGGMVAVHQFTRIGCHAMVGGFSGIVQDIPPYMIAAGARAKLYGPNTIGLKRNGLSDTAINAIKNAYKILFREKMSLIFAMKKVRAEMSDIAEVNHLIEFIEKNKRGICR